LSTNPLSIATAVPTIGMMSAIDGGMTPKKEYVLALVTTPVVTVAHLILARNLQCVMVEQTTGH